MTKESPFIRATLYVTLSPLSESEHVELEDVLRTTLVLSILDSTDTDAPHSEAWASIRSVPELFPDGEVIALDVFATTEQIEETIGSLSSAGLVISRGDEPFETHGE